MSRSRSRLAADWFAKLRLNDETNKVEHTEVKEDINNLSMSAADILTEIKTVDGSGSGLDADTVDGIQGSSIVTKSDNQALHDTDALRISGSTLYLYKGNGGNESVALPSSAPTAAQVGSATAGLARGAVGSYAIGRYNSGSSRALNSTGPGSSIKYYDSGSYYSQGLAGTWRVMGGSAGTGGVKDIIFLRIA
jgi:hypothetical protein